MTTLIHQPEAPVTSCFNVTDLKHKEPQDRDAGIDALLATYYDYPFDLNCSVLESSLRIAASCLPLLRLWSLDLCCIPEDDVADDIEGTLEELRRLTIGTLSRLLGFFDAGDDPRSPESAAIANQALPLSIDFLKKLRECRANHQEIFVAKLAASEWDFPEAEDVVQRARRDITNLNHAVSYLEEIWIRPKP